MTDTYSIMCESQHGSELGVSVLGLVDRRKTRRLWWTSDEPALLLRYESREAAEYACKRLKHNGPRVVTSRYAEERLSAQRQCIADAKEQIRDLKDHEAAMDAVEWGWDGHKTFSGSGREA